MWLLFPLLMTGFRRRCLGWRCWCWKLEGTSPSGLRFGNLMKILAFKIHVIGTRRIVEILSTNAKWRCSIQMMIPLCLIDTTWYDSILRTMGSNMALHVMFFWTSRIDWLMNGLSDWYFKCSQRADDHELVFEIVFLSHDMFGGNGWQGVQPT